MSEPYEIFVFIPTGISAIDAIYKVHEVFVHNEGYVDEDLSLNLNSTETEDPEPENIMDIKAAFEKLSDWPSFGSISYVMPECLVDVYYGGSEGSTLVEVVIISILQQAFDRGGNKTMRRYKDIAKRLHEKLNARRTIMDWGISYKGFQWEDEVNRLERGEYIDSYELIDLR